MEIEESMDVKGISINTNTNNNTALLIEEDMDLRRGPWTYDEDLTLINYIATHGEGRWNSLARSAGLKRTGKSCRLRWLNYLRPDVRRGNITLEEQLLILELHTRWGNRWSKIAQYLPGRTDNEIKNYWRTRVQKHAKQLKCDVNSKQFKDAMRYLWMPRLVERIQAAAAASTATATATVTSNANSPTLSTSTTVTTANINNNNNKAYPYNSNNNNFEIHDVKMALTPHQAVMMNNDFVGSSQVTTQSYNNTPEENSSTAASSDSFGTQVSPISDLNNDYYGVQVSSNNNNKNPNPNLNSNPGDNYYPQPSQVMYSDYHGLDNQGMMMMMEPNTPWMQSGDTSDNFWNFDNIMFLEQQLMNDNIIM